MEIPIVAYREFYDVPRCFFVAYTSGYAFFDCPFDDLLDDYPDEYRVYFFPNIVNLNLNGSWEAIAEAGVEIGKVPVARVEFDSTRRKSISSDVLEELTK
ncbi:MAG TPA: hypothetical protein VHK01_15365 [Lacipirellulaceae bacterium]|jgi:hypothetical protein|nr:hypothetical protein [Lacipirellulaceae bacterium]